jgi:dTDP-4-dehydrorhamnose 3,5-epimerase
MFVINYNALMEKNKQTVTPEGREMLELPEGVKIRPVYTHVDERGFVVEAYDVRWNFHPNPLVFSHVFTIRPGMAKGWGMHKKHDDRYFILFGEMEMLLYDDRDNSPTKGLVSKFFMTEYERRLLSIPSGVWHASRNIGQRDVVVIDFPTVLYDHADPDKYRLPLNNDKIPYKFDNPMGG